MHWPKHDLVALISLDLVSCRVNEFNVDVLIACGLPYHATNHFVRLVQLLHLDNTCWKFLSPMQKSGAAMPRALLVQRCINDQASASCISSAALMSSHKCLHSLSPSL